jgi:hypothetical protein
VSVIGAGRDLGAVQRLEVLRRHSPDLDRHVAE